MLLCLVKSFAYLGLFLCSATLSVASTIIPLSEQEIPFANEFSLRTLASCHQEKTELPSRIKELTPDISEPENSPDKLGIFSASTDNDKEEYIVDSVEVLRETIEYLLSHGHENFIFFIDENGRFHIIVTSRFYIPEQSGMIALRLIPASSKECSRGAGACRPEFLVVTGTGPESDGTTTGQSPPSSEGQETRKDEDENANTGESEPESESESDSESEENTTQDVIEQSRYQFRTYCTIYGQEPEKTTPRDLITAMLQGTTSRHPLKAKEYANMITALLFGLHENDLGLQADSTYAQSYNPFKPASLVLLYFWIGYLQNNLSLKQLHSIDQKIAQWFAQEFDSNSLEEKVIKIMLRGTPMAYSHPGAFAEANYVETIRRNTQRVKEKNKTERIAKAPKKRRNSDDDFEVDLDEMPAPKKRPMRVQKH